MEAHSKHGPRIWARDSRTLRHTQLEVPNVADRGRGGIPEAPPHSALHRSHLALQVDSLGPANIVCIDDLHDVGAAKALFLHLLRSPDAGELDEGAFLGQPEKGG